MKTGEHLVNEGIVSEDQINEALTIQKKNPDRKIGEILLELGYIDIDKFTKIVDKQLREEGLIK